MSNAAAVELGAAAVALVGVIWLARALLLAHRWRQLIDALERLAYALERLEVVEVEVEADEPLEGD